jgi:hypothetical protein
MPAAESSLTWQAALIGYLTVMIAAFLVTWVVTDLFNVRRTIYVGVLALLVIGLGGWYTAFSAMTLGDAVGSNAMWGLVAGLGVAVLATPVIRRLPQRDAPAGLERAELFAWEDVIYGAAEALLLAVYPVITLWHAVTAAGWTDTGVGKVPAGMVAIVGSLLVILVHHLGYAQFRTRAARRMLAGAVFVCGLQALAFLVTGALIAPIVAHIILHIELTMRGNELPPVAEDRGGAKPFHRYARESRHPARLAPR